MKRKRAKINLIIFPSFLGIFFDDLDKDNKEETFHFIQSCANAIIPGYEPIVRRNYLKEYTEQDREWQLLRRGR